MALGAALKEARVRKKLTASEVASGTRMKVQVVTALEEEDFEKIAAPIYAKGFIKLYAEFVGLDAQALITEYVERFVEAKPVDESPDVVQETRSAPAPQKAAKPISTQTVAEDKPIASAAPESAPEPAAAPDVMRPADDGELDLFSEVEPDANERRGILMDDGYREVVPSLRDRIAHSLAAAVDALQHACDSVGAVCRRGCGGGVDFLVNMWKRLVQTVKARRRELSQIDFKNLSARHMMALLGVLVLILLVISSLSRCVRGKGEAERDGTTAPLPVAAEPADVYLD